MGSAIDLTGQRFGHLVATERAVDPRVVARWRCRCDCGQEAIVVTAKLRNGHTKSCGCLHRETHHKRSMDLTGQRFGRLVAMERTSGSNSVAARWRCQCDCGEETSVTTAKLTTGWTQSCGCLHREKTGEMSRTHGRTRTSEYQTWASAKGRCYRLTDAAYANYGGRGIVMCDEWRDDFAAFYRDMGQRPHKTSIDRIDNDGPYSKDNCRWATKDEQANNIRSNHVIVYAGETHTLSEWANRVGISQASIGARLRLGWSVERALTTPVRA